MLTPEGAKMAASGKMAASSRQNGALQEGAKMAASSVQGEKNTSKNTSSSEKETKGNSLSSPTGGPLAGRSIFSSLSSPKEERQEPAWFDEIRGMYPGTTVNDDLKRIEEWARKKRKEFTRDLALNALRRNPPKKPGQREGYVYHGKFIGKEKANALAAQNAELLLNAKRAIRHADGQIEMR